MASPVDHAHAPTPARNLLYLVAFKLRALLMVPLVAVLVLCTRWRFDRDLDDWLIGLPLFLAGVALRVWSQVHLRYRLRDGHALATSGPYAYVRNPVYFGNALLLSAVAVLCELPWMIPVTIVYAACVYGLAVRYEETRLEKRFGEEFRRYCAQVPRWLVRRPRARDTVRPQRATWWRAAAVEWQCLLLLAVPIVKECLEGVLPAY